MSKRGRARETESKLVVARGCRAEEGEKLRVTAGGYEVSFRGDQNVLESDLMMVGITPHILKTAKLYIIKRVNFPVCDFQNKNSPLNPGHGVRLGPPSAGLQGQEHCTDTVPGTGTNRCHGCLCVMLPSKCSLGDPIHKASAWCGLGLQRKPLICSNISFTE